LESRFARLLLCEYPPLALRARLLLALAIFLVALVLRLGTLPVERGFPFLPFYPAMLAAALFLGAGPGLMVVALSTVGATFFFLPPYNSFVIKLGSLPALLTFVLCGVLTCGLAHFTRRTLLALQAARRKLLRLQETLPVGLVLTDLDGRFLEFNQAFAALTGYSAAELRRLDCWALTPAKYAAEEARQLRILKETGRLGPFEKEYVRKDGTVVPVKIAGSLFESGDGARGIWSIVEDLTERRRVQGGLEELLREQRAILDSRVVGIVRAKNRHIVWANEQFAQMLGYCLEEIIGKPTRMFYPSADAHADFAVTAFPIIARGEIFKAELPQRYKSGAVGWFEITSGKLGEDEQIATFVDVTERRRIAAELQHARSDLQAILDHMPARITSWNLDWTNCFANRFAEKQFGIDPGSATGRHVRDIIGADRYQRTKHHIEASFRGTPQTYEQVEELPNGSLRFSQVTAVPRCQDGVVTGTYVLATDVTDLRITQEMLSAKLEELQRTEQALRESENRLRAITDNVPVAIALYDCADRIQFANREFRRLAAKRGRAPDASAADDSVEVMRHEGAAELRARAREGEAVRFTISARLDDALRELEVTYVPYLDAGGAVTGVYEMSYDVTELRESHARIRELAERLASVREDERRAVAVRLHEGLAQELYAAHLSLQELERDGGERTGVSDLARQLTRAIDQSIADVRNITNHLYPTSLVHLPLLRAIEQLASQFSKRAGVRVSVRQMPEFPDLDTETRVLFFRTAQETLANVARHAAASSVSISLEADSERVAMLVTDDGKGIADADLHKAGSLGLLGIRERFAAAGGGLIVNHSAPSGTCVTVFVPSPAAETPLNGALCDAAPHAAELVRGRGV
jgi:PAS domain S-box-containing protein